MGTRNLVCVVVDKKMKVAQYGQWDGYLSGQGKTILEFIQDHMDLDRFKQAVRECRWLKASEVRQTWVNSGDDPKNKTGSVSCDIADKHAVLYPGLNRDTGAEILRLIQDGKFTKMQRPEKGDYFVKEFTCDPVRGLVNEKAFAGDSLFCEWAYVLDLDKETLEIYQGFNKDKAKGRFARTKTRGKEYNAINLWRTLTLKEASKTDAFEKLEVELKKENPDEE